MQKVDEGHETSGRVGLNSGKLSIAVADDHERPFQRNASNAKFPDSAMQNDADGHETDNSPSTAPRLTGADQAEPFQLADSLSTTSMQNADEGHERNGPIKNCELTRAPVPAADQETPLQVMKLPEESTAMQNAEDEHEIATREI
jgi:hypothetical protein